MNNKQPTPRVQITLSGEEVKEDWNFARENTSYLTHGLHDYPARMIPQIARRLLDRYTKRGEKIIDPFCGSGTTLVEARLLNRNAIGIDINPFAVLLSNVKATPIDFEAYDFNAREFLSGIAERHRILSANQLLPKPPELAVPNLNHWFKKRVAIDLEFLYQEIVKIEPTEIQDFLKIVFSDTLFKTSNIDLRSSRFIRIRKPEDLKKYHPPDVLAQFQKKLFDSISRMDLFRRELREQNIVDELLVSAQLGDARQLPFINGEFDGAITSPPYGEEKNTIGYERWSKLSAAWLRMDRDEHKAAGLSALGKSCSIDVLDRLEELPSETAKQVLRGIAETDRKRIVDALPFFFDYLETFRQIHRILNDQAHYCVVIGHRSIRKKLLDMGEVTTQLANEAGFKQVHAYSREIPIKLIPWGTPTGKTISKESVIILQKNDE